MLSLRWPSPLLYVSRCSNIDCRSGPDSSDEGPHGGKQAYAAGVLSAQTGSVRLVGMPAGPRKQASRSALRRCPPWAGCEHRQLRHHPVALDDRGYWCRWLDHARSGRPLHARPSVSLTSGDRPIQVRATYSPTRSLPGSEAGVCATILAALVVPHPTLDLFSGP